MKTLVTIDDIQIRQDSEGRYCLNDLHRAAGGENRHRPSLWLENQQTQALIKEIETETGKAGIPAISSRQKLGTSVIKEGVYAYAMWISPAFHLRVIRTFDALVTGKLSLKDTALDAAKLFRPFFQLARTIGCDKNAAAISANNLVYKLTQFKLLEAMGQTHLIAENQSGRAYCPTDLGNPHDLSGQKVNKLLEAAGLQVKDQNGDWKPTEKAKGLYRWTDTMRRHHDGTFVQQLLWFDPTLPKAKSLLTEAVTRTQPCLPVSETDSEVIQS